MNKEIDLTNKKSNEIIDEYYKIALDTESEVKKYERVPELIEAFVENYSLVKENNEEENSSK